LSGLERRHAERVRTAGKEQREAGSSSLNATHLHYFWQYHHKRLGETLGSSLVKQGGYW
jgi:hypothetical protein